MSRTKAADYRIRTSLQGLPLKKECSLRVLSHSSECRKSLSLITLRLLLSHYDWR